MQTLAVVHEAVHPFHAQPSNLSSIHFQQHEPPSSASDTNTPQSQSSNAVEFWLCEVWDTVTHSEVNITTDVTFSPLMSALPGLVLVEFTTNHLPLYPSFWSRAPPAYFV